MSSEQKANQLNNLNDRALQQLEQLTYEKHLETARKLRDERADVYVTAGIQRAAKEFHQETQQMFQSYLDQFNDQHAKAVLDAQANLPELESEHDFNLQLPSLDNAVEKKKSTYGVLKSSNDDSEYPDDLQSIFEN